MAISTRVDRVVWLRERVEEGAIAGLARTHADLDRARTDVVRATAATRADARAPGAVELWVLDEDRHRLAVQALHRAHDRVERATAALSAATDRYAAARRDVLAARRIQERRLQEVEVERARRERRTADEIATLKFNSGT